MASCCTAPRCACRVTAGPGVTIDGNGSAAAPYVVSVDSAAPTVVQAADSPTVDVTVAGTGTSADPYEVSADVILDPAPPGGGDNLLHAGPDGLYLECEQVRGCLTAGPGITYDETTGEIAAEATPVEPTALEGADSSSVTTGVTGTGTAADPFVVTSSVILDPAPPGGGDQLIQSGPDGLSLECADVRGCFTAGDGAGYDPDTGVITARPSEDAGNTIVYGADGGLFTPAPAAPEPTALQAADTTTVDTTVTGTGTAADPYTVEADVIVAPDPNGLAAGPDGLDVAPSVDPDNQLAFGTDGRLFVPPDPPLEVGCGLQGAGTAASPLAANPAAGQEAWADTWSCAPATHSTIKCDPTDGTLWTPPDHYSAADSIYVEHFDGGWADPVTATDWRDFTNDSGVTALVQFNVPAAFLGNDCRVWEYLSVCAGTFDISWTADATFEVGYGLSKNGGTIQVRPVWGILTPTGAAGRARHAGTAQATGFNLAPDVAQSVVFYVLARVMTGSFTINGWESDASIHTTTSTL